MNGRPFTIFCLLAWFWGVSGCVQRAAVYNPTYDFSKIHKVAVLGFEPVLAADDSGAPMMGVMEKLLLQAGYQVVERNAVDKIIAEQNFQLSGAVEPRQAITIGKMLGADALIFGNITLYSPHESSVILVDINTQTKEPIISKRKIQRVEKGVTTTEEVNVVTDYKVTTRTVQKPQVYRIQAEYGAVVKMVDTQTGEIAWVGNSTQEAFNIQTAAEMVGKRIFKSLKKLFPVADGKGV